MNSMSVSGRLMKPDGTALESTSVSFEFTITDPSGNCTLFKETSANLDTSSSGGLFDVALGSGTRVYGNELVDILNNSTANLPCDGGATYTPALDSERILKIKFFDNTESSPTWRAFSPSIPLKAVGHSMYSYRAGKLGDFSPSDLLAKPAGACNAGELLSYDGTNLNCANSVADSIIAGLSIDKLVNGAGKYFNYKPNNVACADNEILKYSTATNGWICAAAAAGGGGTVTSVSATAPLVVSGTAPAPIVSMSQANGATDGWLSQTDWTTFNGKQGSNAELTAVGGIATTGILQRTGAATYTTLGVNAPLNITAGNIGIANISAALITTGTLNQAQLPTTVVLDGGNSPGSALTVGTTTAQSLNLATAGSTRMVVSSTGTVSLNNTILMKPATSNASSTIDFSAGNLQYTSQNCTVFSLHNMKDGGSYTFAVKGATSATCSFFAYSDAGSTGLTIHMPPDHAATTASKHTMYTFLVLGTDVYVSWMPGL